MSTTARDRAREVHRAPGAAGRPSPDHPAPSIVHLTGRGARPPWRRRLPLALLVAALVAAATAATAFAIRGALDRDESAVLGPGVATVEIGIEMSTFDLGSLRVREGTVLQLVVRNDDPIDHELVVGDGEVHRRHADGTERRHPPVPGEVSVAPGDTGMTFYRFDEPGTVVYACHLPGHVAYGMIGEIEVVPA